MTIVIRAARSEDDTALRDLDLATWSWDVSPAPAPPRTRPFFAPEDDPADVLVAVDGEALAGYVRLGPALPLESSRHVLEVKGLAVGPAHVRRGIGRALIEAAVQEATARRARRLTLRVLGPNVGARALYAACGFVEEGRLHEEFLLAGRYVDDVLMARDLTEAVAGRG